MASLRGIIIALIILGAGIYAIQQIGEIFLAQPGLPAEVSTFSDLIKSTRGLTNVVLMGIGGLVVLLIIVWVVRKARSRPARAPPEALPPPEGHEEETAELPEEEREEEEK